MKQKSWMKRLLDMNDSSVSASTVFLIATSMVALLLLLVPISGMVVDIIYNHTITINMSDMAAYIASAAGIFSAGSILKGWTNYSNYRFNKPTDNNLEESSMEQYTE